MKKPAIVFAAVVAVLTAHAALRAGEIKTIQGDVPGSESLSLAVGESARLVWYGRLPNGDSADISFTLQVGNRSVQLAGLHRNNFQIAGPATIKINPSNAAGELALATLEVERLGVASPPSCIPIEAGSNFSVILESSADLVNWTPANPGTYSGTETKRFFRTRILKQ